MFEHLLPAVNSLVTSFNCSSGRTRGSASNTAVILSHTAAWSAFVTVLWVDQNTVGGGTLSCTSWRQNKVYRWRYSSVLVLSLNTNIVRSKLPISLLHFDRPPYTQIRSFYFVYLNAASKHTVAAGLTQARATAAPTALQQQRLPDTRTDTHLSPLLCGITQDASLLMQTV